MLKDSEAQKAAAAARKAKWYINIEKPRQLERRLARMANRPARVILPSQPHKPKRLNLREIMFEPRTKPLPAHPPIRTVWQPLAEWEMAA